MRTRDKVLDEIERRTGIRPSEPWLTVRKIRGDISPVKTISANGANVTDLISDEDVETLVAGIRTKKWFPR